MSRTKNEGKKTKREKSIEMLTERLGLKTQKELLRLIHKEIGKAARVEDLDTWLDIYESNFSKMKKGGRKFPLEFKYALSELAGTSFTKFDGGELDTVDDLSFKTAAQRNDPEIYERLYKLGGEGMFFECDEFGKYFIDRVLEYNDTDEMRAVAIRFLASHNLAAYSDAAEAELEFILSAIRLDDVDVYGYILKKFKDHSDPISPHYEYRADLDELRAEHQAKILDTTLGTENILSMLLTAIDQEKLAENYVTTEETSYYLGYCVHVLLIRALETESPVTERILRAYAEEIREQCKRFKDKHGAVPDSSLSVNMGDGVRYDTWETYGDIAVKSGIYRIGEKRLALIKERHPKLWEALDPEHIRRSLSKHELAELEDGEDFRDRIEGKYYRKEADGPAYELLRLASERGFKNLPTYYGCESGVHITELNSLALKKEGEADDGITLPETVRILSGIHELSREALGEGRVYALKDILGGMRLSYYRYERDGSCGVTPVLDGWVTLGTEIKPPVEVVTDLVCKLLLTHPYEYDLGVYVNNIIDALGEYECDRSLLCGFGDKLLAEIEKRLDKIDRKKNKPGYIIHANVRTKIEAYLDEFNSIGV